MDEKFEFEGEKEKDFNYIPFLTNKGYNIYYHRNRSEITIDKVVEKARDWKKYINYIATINSGNSDFFNFEEAITNEKDGVRNTKNNEQEFLRNDDESINYDAIKDFVESGEHIKSVVLKYLNEIVEHLHHIAKSYQEDIE